MTTDSPPLAPRHIRPWLFVPTLYFMQTVPNSVVSDVVPVILKPAGVSNTRILDIVAVAMLPWSFKYLWAPVVGGIGTGRRWVLGAQLAGALAMLLVGLGLASDWALPVAAEPHGSYFTRMFLSPGSWLVCALVVVALCAATYDLAADGLYIASLSAQQVRSFTGVLTVSARVAKLVISGWFVAQAGGFSAAATRASASGERPWGIALMGLAGVQLATWFWHFWALPADEPKARTGPLWAGMVDGMRSFFSQPSLWAVLLFIALYRLSEAMLTPMISLFLQDDKTGLAMSAEDVGWLTGVAGMIGLLAGGVIGGWLLSKAGDKLHKAVLPMALCMHLPNLLFVWAATTRPGFSAMAVVTCIEKFGYGFGFSAFLVVLMSRARKMGHPTTYYALASGIAALVLNAAVWAAGRLQAQLGYTGYFVLVCVMALPGLAALYLLPETSWRRKATPL